MQQVIEITKVLQKFVSQLQQMQIDESGSPQPSYAIVKAIRFLEYDLRDFIEMQLRSFVSLFHCPTVSNSSCHIDYNNLVLRDAGSI